MIPIAFFFGGGKRTDQTAGHKEGLSGSMTIAWDDQFKRQNIMWKVPRNVRMNDNVVVREDEIAVFYRDGKVLAYLDRPDRYALTSQNAPILGKLIQALSGVVQQAEVYYLQKRIFDGKFGTQDAFLFQDPDFDMVQLRAFGDFRYRLKDPETFINQFVGTFGAATSAEVEDRIKGEIVKQLNVTLGKMKANGLKVVDFAASLNDIEQGTLANSKPHFLTLGIEILQISGLNIPLPDTIKEALEKMASAKVLGRTNAAAYQQFAFADSMKAAAAPVPGWPRGPRQHEVLPGVRQAGPGLNPWKPLRLRPRAGRCCPICRRPSSWRWRRSGPSSSRRSSGTSCSSRAACGSTSASGGPD